MFNKAEECGREAWLSGYDDTAARIDLRAHDLYPTQANVDAWIRGWFLASRVS